MNWALDLDGVIWRGTQQIEGSSDAVRLLRAGGVQVGFVTNSSWKTRADYLEKLSSVGIDADESALVHSGDAVAHLVSTDERVLVCAGEAVVEGLEASGAHVIRYDSIENEVPEVDTVVVAWVQDNDYRRLTIATQAVLNGARLLAPNADRLYPTSDGFVPGSGALVNAVAYAASVVPVVAGKPNQAMADAVTDHLGQIDVMVGDQPATDGGLAVRLDAAFGLVHSGVTPADHGSLEPTPRYEAANLYELVRNLGY